MIPAEIITDIRKGITAKENCGLITTSFKVYPITNVSTKPSTFVMHKTEYLKTLNLIRASGEEVLLVYHTHPFGTSAPSTADLEYFKKSPFGMLIVATKDHYVCLE